jgi:hypothetical protein
MPDIPLEDAKSKVLSEVQGYFSGPAFKVTAWPKNARQVPESSDLQLVLCEDEKTAKSVCAYADDSDVNAPIPRRFQNAIFAVTATGSSFNSAVDRAQRLLAAEAIEREHRTGDSGKLIREQLKKLQPELQKQFRIQTCRAFDRVVLPGSLSYSVEEEFQVPDEQIMQKAHGQASLRKFLDSKNLIYQPGDALDVGRFLRDVLPGAIPVPDKPDVYTAKAVHERFLGAPGLRLIPDGGIVRQTLLKAMAEGKVVIRLSDGRAYDANGCVEGAEGKKRRVAGNLTTFALDETVQIARSESTAAKSWTKEDFLEEKKGKGPGEPDIPKPPPPPSRVTATTWEKTLESAVNRPLLNLTLRAQTPGEAATLLNLAQPLGADSLSLSVTVSGTAKEGGDLQFCSERSKTESSCKTTHNRSDALQCFDRECNLRG